MKKEIKSIERNEKFFVEIKSITMPVREEFMDVYSEAQEANPQKFSLWCRCVRIVTDITDEELLLLTDQDIVQIAMELFLDLNNKKKVKK